MILCGLERYQESIECLNSAIEIDPSFDHAYYSKGTISIILGLTLKKLHREKEAIICFNKALELNPSKTEALNQKGINYF